MGNRILLLFLFFLLSCKPVNNIDAIVEGSWSLYQLEYGIENKSLLYEDGNSSIIFARPMYISPKGNFITIDLEQNKQLQAKIKVDFSINEVHIYESSDKRFDGQYQIWIDTLSTNAYRNEYKLLLESDSIFMVATKIVVKKF